MKNKNVLLDVDSYKASHHLQYPPGTTSLFSYLESRGGKYGQTVFFGLQYILNQLSKGFTAADVEEAAEVFEKHGLGCFPKDQFLNLVASSKDGIGMFPVRIRAVQEGSVIPTNNVLMTVENTDPDYAWVTSYIETQLMRVWYPVTVATQSWHIKRLIKTYLDVTSDDSQEIDFKLHDFGSRGVSSWESAALGGLSHLVNFKGSDTVPALMLGREIYGENMAAFSIPAAEHSTITAWGKENEAKAYENMLKQFAKTGSLVAVVSDSYDLWSAINNIWGGSLRAQVINSGATIIIRPDSGVPHEVVLKTLELLDEKFGSTYNTKAFKVLNNVRVIQGDGINEESIRLILETAKSKGYSASNIAFGMGGALLQQVNRDTQRFAYKASSIVINGKRKAICKAPVTDMSKASKAGVLDLIKRDGKYQTVVDNFVGSELITVFENGRLMNKQTLSEIRARAKAFAMKIE